MHENLWTRMKVAFEKHRETFFENSMFKPPYIDFGGYFQSSLPLTLHMSMFRLSIENLANE